MKKHFRDYSKSDNDKNNKVAKTYKKMLEKQTLKYVLSKKKKYQKYPNIKKHIWKVFDLLDNIIDESDPDTDLPQIIHAYQTAQALQIQFIKYQSNQLKTNLKIKDLFRKNEWMIDVKAYHKKIDGLTTEDFYNATSECVNRINENPNPYLIECMTTRWRDHVGVTDPELSEQQKDSIRIAIDNDDLKNLEKKLTKDTIIKIKRRVESEIEKAVNFAETSEFPDKPELYDNVYG